MQWPHEEKVTGAGALAKWNRRARIAAGVWIWWLSMFLRRMRHAFLGLAPGRFCPRGHPGVPVAALGPRFFLETPAAGKAARLMTRAVASGKYTFLGWQLSPPGFAPSPARDIPPD